MNEMEELKQEFLSEANELLLLLEEEVLNLEGEPTNRESVNSIFRVAHTLKGGAAALELDRVAVFTHNLENLLDLVRDDKLEVDEELIDIVLQSLDILKEMIRAAAISQEAAAGFEEDTLESIKNKAGVVSKPSAKAAPSEIKSPVSLESSPAKPQSIDTNFDSMDDSIKAKLINDFNINDAKLQSIKEGFKQKLSLYVIYVSLDSNYEMKSVSGIQTITAMKSIGEIIECIPPLNHIMVEEFVPQIQFLVLSKASSDQIYSKIYLSDVVLDIEIENVGELFGQDSESGVVTEVREPQVALSTKVTTNLLDIFPKQEMTPDIKTSIQMALEDGEKAYNIRIAINKDVPMRDVDSLLVLTTLEEIGDIISAVPSKRDLQKDIFYPVLDIIIQTSEDQESIKERCIIEETTLEIRIANYLKKGESVATSQESEIKHVQEASYTKEDIYIASDQSITAMETTVMGSAPVFESILDQSTIDAVQEDVGAKLQVNAKNSLATRLESVEEARIKGKDMAQSALQPTLRSFIKVDSTRVDSLLNLVGELVITKAALLEIAAPFMDMVSEYKLGLQDSFSHLKTILAKNPDTYPEVKKIVTYLNSVAVSWANTETFESTVGSISRSINELQGGIMKIRMVPIGNVFNKFSRTVRDVSKQLGKKITLNIIGEDTELDKSVIEELSDPLMHMVRNSVDHGIEMPNVRISNGKPVEGQITLKAVHEGNVIRIEVRDDGAGLDPVKIQKKAIEKGLLNASKNLTKEEVLQLILLPGFSTAEKVTGLSGRGVGMDVVRRNIEDLSGTVSISSELGKGSVMILKIPLTLSIIQALIIKIQGYYFSIPLNVVSETVPLDQSKVQHFERSDIIYINEEMVTIVNMKELFNIKETREERFKKYQESMSDAMDTELLDESIAILEKSGVTATASQLFSSEYDHFSVIEPNTEDVIEEFLVIVNVGNKKIGIVVDNIISEQDIVIKPLHKEYGLTQGVSGATILGDGRISLILDVFQLTDLYLRKDDLISLG